MIPVEVYSQTISDFLAPVASYLADPRVTEIMINGPDQIYIERGGMLEQVDAKFTPRQLLSAIRNIAQFQGVTVDAQNPILEARLPDGSRVEAVLPPAGCDGPHLAIRRFAKQTLTVAKLVGFGALTEDAATLLQALVESKQNVIVAGGTGSGKTSMLNALSSFIPAGERVVVIEDARELQLQMPHVVHLASQKPDPHGRGRVTTGDLFRASLRMRPDRIVVGEIRGGEAMELIQAMTSGHGGCMSTVHASYPTDTLHRLETMAMMSDVQLPLPALRAQVASAVDIIVQTSRLRSGARCVTHISEVTGLREDGDYRIVDLFRRVHEAGSDDGAVTAQLLPTGLLPACGDALAANGVALPPSMYEAARAFGRSARS